MGMTGSVALHANSNVDYDMVCNAGVLVFDCKNIIKCVANKENIEVL